MRSFVQRGEKKKAPLGIDKVLLFLTLGLSVFGIVAVADVSAPQAVSVFNDPFYFAKQQSIWAAVGLLAMLLGVGIDYRFWRRFGFVIFLGSLLLLLFVLLPGVGSSALGAQRWIILGPISFQPSEIMKLAMIMFFALLADREYSVSYFIVSLVLVVGLIMLQPDLGTTIVISVIAISQMFLAGIALLSLVGMVIFGGIASSLMVLFSDYRKARLMSFLENSTDPLGSSYHIRQILIAIGSGGIFGVGIGQSRQKYLFLPETATDSVFAILAEELGFIGSLIIIALLLVFIYRIFRIAFLAPDKYSQVLAGGIAVWIGAQTIANLGSMVAIMPLTGIPLPFFSYGGSSLITILFSVGILLNISKNSSMQRK